MRRARGRAPAAASSAVREAARGGAGQAAVPATAWAALLVRRLAALPNSPQVVLAVAALFGLGSVPTVCLMLRELELHAALPGRGALFGLAALGAGFIGGVWIPRRLIVRHISQPGSRRVLAGGRGVAAVAGTTDFAALVVGVLMLAAGVFYCAQVFATGELENWRGALAANVTLPGGIKQTIFWTLAGGGLMACGALGATVLTALYGWRKAASGSRFGDSRFWISMIASAALGAMACALARDDVAVGYVLVAPVFVGGMIAALARPAQVARGALAVGPAATSVPWKYVGLLLAGGASWGALTVSGILARAEAGAGIDATLAGMLVGAAAGTALARLAADRSLGTRRAALVALAAMAVLATLPLSARQQPNLQFLRLAVASGALAAVAALVDARLGVRLGSRQLALAFGVSAVLCGAGAACVGTLASGSSRADGAACGIIAALSTLLLGRAVARPAARRGLLASCVGIAALNLARLVASPSPPVTPVRPSGGDWLMGVLATETRVLPAILDGRADEASAALAQVDLLDASYELIRLADSPRTARGAATVERWARIVARCVAALPVHGRLVIEQPTEFAAQAVFRAVRRGAGGWEVYVATSADGGVQGAALLVSRGPLATMVAQAAGDHRRLVRVQGVKQFLAARRALAAVLTPVPAAR